MASAPKKSKTIKTTKKGKTVDPKKVTDVSSWASYFKKGYQNIVVDTDGSFLVLDPELTKTDYKAALEDPVKTIPHLMGEDYMCVLADNTSSSELRAAAEARLDQINAELDARINAAKLAYSEAEAELINLNERWKHAPDAPNRIILAQAVAEANAAVAAAESTLRAAQAPHRYIIDYTHVTRNMLIPGSGDDRPIKNIIYRAVPAKSEAPERVINVGGRGSY